MEQPPSYPPPPPGGYGYQPPPPGGGYGYPPPQSVGTNPLAIGSLVCSLLGWACVIGPIVGLILGFVALGQIKQTGQGGRGLAIAGIIIGAVVTVAGIGFFILSLVLGATAPPKDSSAPFVMMLVEQQAVSRIAAV
jgi:uncharacterized membrane protein